MVFNSCGFSQMIQTTSSGFFMLKLQSNSHQRLVPEPTSLSDRDRAASLSQWLSRRRTQAQHGPGCGPFISRLSAPSSSSLRALYHTKHLLPLASHSKMKWSLAKQIISGDLFIAGQSCLALTTEFIKSFFLTTKQKYLPVISKFCSSQGLLYLKVLVMQNVLR